MQTDRRKIKGSRAEQMRLCSIASGSSGNCIYAGTDTTHVLVDAGISGKRVENGLNDIGLTGRDIDAILITHEHVDHIIGLGVLSRRYGIPIYTTEKDCGRDSGNEECGKDSGRAFSSRLCRGSVYN